MKLRKYNDGKYRGLGSFKLKDGTEVEALFTSSVHPSEIKHGWELTDLKTSDGKHVVVPKPEEVDVDVDELNMSMQSDLPVAKLKVNW